MKRSIRSSFGYIATLAPGRHWLMRTMFLVVLVVSSLKPVTACPWYNPLCLVEGVVGWVDD